MSTSFLFILLNQSVEYPSEIYNQNAYLIDDEQSNLILYNQFLEQMKATYNQEHHPKHGEHPFTRLKEKFKKIFLHHKKEPQDDHKGI